MSTNPIAGTDTIYNNSSEKAALVQINKAKKTCYKLGDVNVDNLINVTDIIQIAAHIKGKKLLPQFCKRNHRNEVMIMSSKDTDEIMKQAEEHAAIQLEKLRQDKAERAKRLKRTGIILIIAAVLLIFTAVTVLHL